MATIGAAQANVQITGGKIRVPGMWDTREAVSYTHLTLPTNREV